MTDDQLTPDAYIAQLPEPRRSEMRTLHELIRSAVPQLEANTGGNTIGYGRYSYRYPSGRAGESFIIGLAAGKRHISVYVQGTENGRYIAEIARERLGKVDVGKACIRLQRVADVNLDALADVIRHGAAVLAPLSS